MNISTLKLVFSALLWVGALPTFGQELVIRVHEVRPGQGPLLVAIYDRETGFPYTPSRAIARLRSETPRPDVELSTNSLKPGRYALALFQDRNGDQRLNTNILGMPKEGYGVSNNAYNTFSAPRFNDAAFQLKSKTVLDIQMKY
jgi:uncharacterized protein (DUF2141 family)